MVQLDGLIIEIENKQDKVKFTSRMKEIITGCIDAVLDAERFYLKVMVDILLVDNSTIKDINLEYRGINKHTDVLSFPILELEPEFQDLLVKNFAKDMDPYTGAVLLGDIVISMEKAKEQALEYGHSFERELGFLVVHSMLHLLGYDHIDAHDRGKMRIKEETILDTMELTRN